MSESISRRALVRNAAAFSIMSASTALGSQANSAITVGLIGGGGRGMYVSGKAAVKSRKHIFLEKAAGVDAAGCRRVLAAAKAADPIRRISMDFQQRYGKDYRKALEVVRSGELGKVKRLRTDAEQQVRAAWMGGQDCHNIDIVNWFMGKHPVRVSGYGSQMQRKKGNIYDNLSLSFQFDDGTIFSYSANQFGNPGWNDISETFVCESGVVQTSRKGYQIHRPGKPVEEAFTKYDIAEDTVNQFIEGVRTGKIENAAIWGAESSMTAVMALQACTSGKEATWDQVYNS